VISETNAGLYVHIPFCRNLCLYCDFYSKIGSDDEIGRFLDALSIESKSAANQFPGYRFDTVFLGGGTPSMLDSNQICRLFESINSTMKLSSDAEITIECNPSSLNAELLETYKAIGVNRISLGVQSFNDSHLRRLGRTHTSAEAREAFDLIRKCGFSNVSLDLIYGLPDQTLDEWADDLDRAVELGPEHISAYNLIIEDETPFGELYKRGELGLPSDNIQGEMYISLNEHLRSAGYERYEISNFARSGYECRHNLKYWRGEPYIGLGPAAVSCDTTHRWKNRADLESYISAIESGQPPPRDKEELTREKCREEYVMLALRQTEGISLDHLRTNYDYDLLRDKDDIIKALETSGYIEIGDGRIKLAEKGLFLADEIIVRML
jgi:oxygen-independent coproporphyrinogen-3 oxidase